MNMFWIIILAALLIGALPLWPYSASWGYYPGGGVGLLLMLALIVAFTSDRKPLI